MKLRKLAAGLLAGVLLTGFAACGGNGSSTAKYQVGICQLTQHPALDAATQGFTDRLKELLGDDVNIDLQNASNDNNNCVTIINSFVSKNVDLILANATTPLQAAASATDTIPILGTSVTDYGTTLGITDWTGSTGRNISGTTDLAPLDGQAAMIQELFPDATNIGLLYCSGEPNSKYQIDVIKGYLEGMGYTCTEYSFSDSNDLSSVCTTACNESDVIYIPTDNTAATNAELIGNIVVPAGVPVVAGEEGICKGCGVATLSIDYYELGKITADMAYEVLVNGADPSTMEVQSAPQFTKEYNANICQQLGITPPEGYTAIPEEE